ncbi:MAG TPA: hypothetical protein VOB72_11325 [Candidatus Dormibacteraeota bacterium]|nr:hypothetical protein [Candidatus Dormibacteraeota bacterium]
MAALGCELPSSSDAGGGRAAPAASPLAFFVRGAYGRDTTCAPPGAEADNGCAPGTGVDRIRAAGFNTVQADARQSALSALRAKGLMAMVWLGGWDKHRCRWEESDARLPTLVAAAKPAEAVVAYYLADEPLLSSCPDAPAAFRARTQLVHRLDPGSRTFTLIQDWDGGPMNYASWKGSVDVLGFDVYPCSFRNAADTSASPKVRQPCDFAGVTRADIDRIQRAGITGYLAVLQDFQDCYYELPTAADLRVQMQEWQRRARGLAGYLFFSWNWTGEECTYGSLGVNLDHVPGNVDELAFENGHSFRP